jgi:hypothetical protein
MRPCCPAGRGCNAADRDEPCALALCRVYSADEPAAALALTRWELFEGACEHQSGSPAEQRFRRRAYERIRDRALVAIAMRSARWLIDSQIKRRRRAPRRGRLRRTGRRARPAS